MTAHSELHLEESGKRGAPAIVLLHGASSRGQAWAPVAERLAPQHHCLMPDLPGHGASRGVRWRSLSESARLVAGLIEARVPGGRAHVVGLSLGGFLVLELLRASCERVDRALVSGVHARPLPRAGLIKLAAPLLAPLYGWRRDSKISRSAFSGIAREAADPRLGSLEAGDRPTLVIAGARELPLIRDSVDRIASALPRGTGRIAVDSGHTWHEASPERFSEVVRAWVGGEPLPGFLEKPPRGSVAGW